MTATVHLFGSPSKEPDRTGTQRPDSPLTGIVKFSLQVAE